MALEEVAPAPVLPEDDFSQFDFPDLFGFESSNFNSSGFTSSDFDSFDFNSFNFDSSDPNLLNFDLGVQPTTQEPADILDFGIDWSKMANTTPTSSRPPSSQSASASWPGHTHAPHCPVYKVQQTMWQQQQQPPTQPAQQPVLSEAVQKVLQMLDLTGPEGRRLKVHHNQKALRAMSDDELKIVRKFAPLDAKERRCLGGRIAKREQRMRERVQANATRMA